MAEHPRPSDDDAPHGLPRSDGAEGEAPSLDEEDEPGEEGDGDTSWIGEEGGTDVDGGDEIDTLAEESVLDDGTLAIDDDPLELDAETTWTDGSEASDDVDDGEDVGGEDEPSASSDDGSEGFDELDALDEPTESRIGTPREDEAAADLDMGALHTSGSEGPALEASLVAIAVVDGELAQVRPGEVRVGGLLVAIPVDGDVLVSATALDDATLLVFGASGRSWRVSLTEGRATAGPEGVRAAAGDGAGGAWVADGTSLSHYPASWSAPSHRIAFDGPPLGLASSPRDGLYVLTGEGAVLRARGAALSPWIDGVLAITCDEAGMPWVARAGAVERLDPGSGAATTSLVLDEGPPPRALAVLPREIVVLRGDETVAIPRPVR